MLTRFCLASMVAIAFAVIAIHAQGPDIIRQPAAVLVDSFGKSNGEERSAKFDNFFIQIDNNPGSTGYVFVFCGKVCRYGEVESHFRGIELKTAYHKYPRDRMVLLHGGYRDSQEVELWLAPPGAGAPVPKGTRNIRDVKFTRSTNRLIEPYDCCGDYESTWKTFRPKQNGQKSRHK